MKSTYFSILFTFVCILSMLIMSSVYAQNDSTFKYDPALQYGSKPQAPVETPEQLHKKLVNARDAISSIMGSKIGNIPFNEVGIDEINSTLDVGIDSEKATLSEEQYLQKIKAIVGDIPIKITFSHITSLPLILANNSVRGNDIGALIQSPLKQFKSGIEAKDVKCKEDFQLVIKSEDGSPACVKPETAQIMIEWGWASNHSETVGKESISLSAYQGESHESFYNNGTITSNFTINVNIKNFRPSNTSLVLQVYYNNGILYKTVSVPSDMIQPDGFYKYDLIAVSDKNHPVPFKIVAIYSNETAIAYAPVFAHP